MLMLRKSEEKKKNDEECSHRQSVSFVDVNVNVNAVRSDRKSCGVVLYMKSHELDNGKMDEFQMVAAA